MSKLIGNPYIFAFYNGATE